MQTIGARFAHGADHARGGGGARLPRLRVARRRLPVPRHGRDLAGGRRSARARGAAQRARALGPADLARHGPPLGPRASLALTRPRHDDARRRHRRRRSATRWSCTRPSAARPTCCCTSPPSRTPPGCARPTVDDWLDVNRRVPRLVDSLPNGPHPDGARVPRRRRARGDAAPARSRPARPVGAHRVAASRSATCSTGGRRRRAGSASASCCASATASIPTT